MSIFGKLFRRAEAQMDTKTILSLLDVQHREIAISIFELLHAGAIGKDELPKYAKMIATLLKGQAAPAGSVPFTRRTQGHVNAKAVGYVYGASDAALQVVGYNMGDEATGVPFLFNVLTELSPTECEPCMEFVIANVGKENGSFMSGMNLGGQEFLALYKSNGTARISFTLAKLLMS